MSSEGREQDLLDWIDGRLPAERRAEIDAHLRECAACRGLVSDMQSISAGLDHIGAQSRGTVVPRVEAPANRRVLQWAAAAAAVLALLSAPLLLRRQPPDVAPAPAAQRSGGAHTGAEELLEVDRALRVGGGGETVARHARLGMSVTVRLAAIAGRADAPASLPSAELLSLFAAEPDLMVQLWLVAELARSGDATAIERARVIVERLGQSAPPELAAAAQSYLVPPRQGRVRS